jgi:hypothetical protein
MAPSRSKPSLDQFKSQKNLNINLKDMNINVKIPAARFLTFRLVPNEKKNHAHYQPVLCTEGFKQYCFEGEESLAD